MMLSFRFLAAASAAAGLVVSAGGCIVPTDRLPAYVQAASMAQRGDWATPLNVPGVGNCYRVDDHLIRGAEPSRAGYQALARLGVKRVINLRADQDYRDEVLAAGMDYVHIKANVWDFRDSNIVAFLRAACGRDCGLTFVNCMRGSDRTGAMVCIYRRVVNGWAADEAIAEMTTGGYGFDSSLGGLVRHLRTLDVNRLARQAGVTPRQPTGQAS